MSDQGKISVTGVTGGTVRTANTAGVVHGGMGNSTRNEGARNIANNSNVGQLGDGGTATGTSFGGGTTPGARDKPANLSSAELLVEVRKFELTEDALNKFEASKITGSLFLSDDLEGLLKDLGIINKIDIRKLKDLRKKLEAK